MAIDSKRLKELRNRKGWSQAKLGERAKVTVRQISRLEGEIGSRSNPRGHTVNQLAKALGVEPGVLTGDLPIPSVQTESTRIATLNKKRVTALIGHEANLAFTLIFLRYGVSLTTLVNVAPMMFVLLAESSFRWRRENLTKIENDIDSLRNWDCGYNRYVHLVSDVDRGIAEEQESIRKHDLFGTMTASEDFGDYIGHDSEECNPFADYLRHLAKIIDNEEIISMAPSIMDPDFDGFPKVSILSKYLEYITYDSLKPYLAIQMGLDIGRMPEHLFEKGADEKRKKWLEQQIEEQFTPAHKELLDRTLEKTKTKETDE